MDLMNKKECNAVLSISTVNFHVNREEGTGACFFLSFSSVCNCVRVCDVDMFSFLLFSLYFSYVFISQCAKKM